MQGSRQVHGQRLPHTSTYEANNIECPTGV